MNLETPYLYLYLMAFTLAVPLIRSFESRVAYYRSFKALFSAIALTMAVFIPWDVLFTHLGIWGFNPKYLSGIYIFNLPLGEWLFFILVPFSCVFIYRVLNYFFPKDWIGQRTSRMLAQYFVWLCLTIAFLSWGKWYTFSAFLFLGILFAIHVYYLRVTWLPSFFRAYLVILIPFLIVNGVLTGTGIEEEVVWYNNAHNLGYRLMTIPVDDIFYGMGLIFMNITLYEYFRARWDKG